MFEKSTKNNKTGIENDIDKKWQGYSTASDKATAMRSQERTVSFQWSQLLSNRYQTGEVDSTKYEISFLTEKNKTTDSLITELNSLEEPVSYETFYPEPFHSSEKLCSEKFNAKILFTRHLHDSSLIKILNLLWILIQKR